jgi:hypothetical protein
MQLILPVFPKEARLINDHLGVYEHDGLIQYILNGLPVYSHAKDDLSSFRFITSNFISEGLCKGTEIVNFFGVSEDSVYRYHKIYEEKGTKGFYGEDGRKGKAHKIFGGCLQRIQAKLDKGQSVNSIAKEEEVAESAIRYRIKIGDLKKSQGRTPGKEQYDKSAE